jgi:hypothetical protein
MPRLTINYKRLKTVVLYKGEVVNPVHPNLWDELIKSLGFSDGYSDNDTLTLMISKAIYE